jgi:Bacterial Ig-like domain (group 2)
MSCTERRALSGALACLVTFVACHSVVAPGGAATLHIRADVSGTSVATVVVDVTAPDIPAALVFNIPIANGVAAGVITVPAGSRRTIAMRAFDAGHVETHSGSITLDIQPASNPTVSLVLQPLTGDVPINVTLGAIIITVTPSSVSLAAGDTMRLAAAIEDWNGNPMVGTVLWATHDPGIAGVDGAGLVTALHAGATTISVTFQGAAGSAAVSVTP